MAETDTVSAMSSAVIVVEGLRKSYGSTEVLHGIDLRVDEGEIVAVLGPNGAGKTTTIEILEGFRTATSGTVQVLGADPARAPRSWREDIGIVLQASRPLRSLTARELLTMHAAYYRSPRPVDSVLELVGLTDQADRRVAKLSGGQQRRVDLGLALVGDPRLIFLDEPTTGFDPAARREAWEMIAGLRALGRTIVLTTHYLDEAQHLADRIAVIADGRIIARGTSAELAEQVRVRPRLSWTGSDPLGLDEAWRRVGDRIEVECDEQAVVSVLHTVTSWGLSRRESLEGLEILRPSLEDTYLRLVDHAGSTDGGRR